MSDLHHVDLPRAGERAQLRSRAAAALEIAAAEHELGAVARESERDLAANAGRGAGDEDDFAFHIHVGLRFCEAVPQLPTIACITAVSKSSRSCPRVSSATTWLMKIATTFSLGSTKKCVLYAPLQPKLPCDSHVLRAAGSLTTRTPRTEAFAGVAARQRVGREHGRHELDRTSAEETLAVELAAIREH